MKLQTAKSILGLLLAALLLPNTWAHSDEHQHGSISSSPAASSGHQHGGHDRKELAFGEAGDPAKVSRTIKVDLLDTMRFGPTNLTVREGEVVRFVLVNKGGLPHELVLGTLDELKAHGAEMKSNPHAAHDDPSSARLEPKQQKSLVWKFTKAGTFYYACLIPGHFEAGMVGQVNVTQG